MLAVKECHLKIVKLLITKGANVYFYDKDNHTALTIAKQNGFKDIADLLLTKDSDDTSIPLATNEKVKFIQNTLSTLGYKVDRHDGKMDKQTRNMINDFKVKIQKESIGVISKSLIEHLLWEIGQCFLYSEGKNRGIKCKDCESSMVITQNGLQGWTFECTKGSLFVPIAILDWLSD